MDRGKSEVISNDNIVGNYYDKYDTKNPIARRLMSGFLKAVTELYLQVGAISVLEVGCGEGLLADHLLRSAINPVRMVASDLSLKKIAPQLDPRIAFHEASIYHLPYGDDSFELVVCCEVLEHISDPNRGLAELARVASKAVLISTPWEPMWRALNLARGKYIRAKGNTPGHIQHFSRKGLIRLASSHLSLTAVRTPLPWTVILGEPH